MAAGGAWPAFQFQRLTGYGRPAYAKDYRPGGASDNALSMAPRHAGIPAWRNGSACCSSTRNSGGLLMAVPPAWRILKQKQRTDNRFGPWVKLSRGIQSKSCLNQ